MQRLGRWAEISLLYVPVVCLIDRLKLRGSTEHTVRGQSGQAYRYPIPRTLRILSVPSALGPSFRRRLLT
jgi:hypothetical protein